MQYIAESRYEIATGLGLSGLFLVCLRYGKSPVDFLECLAAVLLAIWLNGNIWAIQTTPLFMVSAVCISTRLFYTCIVQFEMQIVHAVLCSMFATKLWLAVIDAVQEWWVKKKTE